MRITFPWGVNAGTGLRYRWLRIEIKPIYITLWSWTDETDDPKETS